MSTTIETTQGLAPNREKDRNEPPYVLPSDEVLKQLGTSAESGLTSDEVAVRQQRYGPNIIASHKTDGPLALLWRQIHNPLIYVLIAAGTVALATGKLIDGAVIFGVVVLNAVIGFIQEYRASRAIESLMGMVPHSTHVLRDGAKRSVAAAELVPGDIVLLESGDKIPADMRLIQIKSLRVDEAALTGESVSVEKSCGLVPLESGLGDRINMAFGGTLVTAGTARAVVTDTGAATELGRISEMLETAGGLETPLTRSIGKLGRTLTVVISLVAALLLGVGLLRGYPWIDAILAAITLAVAAIPEGLPSIITIALAIGVRRMASRHAVIRQLPAVETLGSTTVICTDKTGTLTRNEMTVRTLITLEHSFDVTGIGYGPQGEIRDGDRLAEEVPDPIRALLLTGILCNDAHIHPSPADGWKITGDPTEAALLVSAAKARLKSEELRAKYRRLDVIPFESEHQCMWALHEHEDSPILHAKGAPEIVARFCTNAPEDLHERVIGLASQGLRVLAFACKQVPSGTQSIDPSETQSGFEFLGLQAMIDPPRPEAVQAIADCHRAGIEVKMITGDHAETARTIASELGLLTPNKDLVVTGRQLAETSDENLLALVEQANVYARVAPEHKLRLVKALQAQGHIVAMTGDGVNDAPALKQSNIGVAMGITGTSVSKEAAAIVLADDNFASIRAAVEEGRRVYDNLIKSLAFVLPTNLGEALIILFAVLFFPLVGGTPLMPIEPVQILWINLVATVALALPLAFEAPEPGLMNRPPRDPKEPVLNRFVVFRTVLVALWMAAAAIGLFLFEYQRDLALGIAADVALRRAQTMAVTTVIFLQVFYLLNCRSLRDSILAIGLWSNKSVFAGIAAILILQVAFVQTPYMNVLFSSAPLNFDSWVRAILVGATILPVISIEKWWRASKARKDAGATALAGDPTVRLNPRLKDEYIS